MAQLYSYNTENAIFICGDFNSRVGNGSDCINFDKIPQRMPKDVSKNSYCEIFLEFLKSTQCCVLNGRFKDDKDNFTSTNRGNAVVDYIVVPHDCFKNCVNFEVLLMTDIICKYNLQTFISSNSKPPDHSAVCVDIYTGYRQPMSISGKSSEDLLKGKKYDFTQIRDCFMANNVWRENIEKVVDKLEHIQGAQQEVNQVYHEFCKCILNEMDKNLNYKFQSTVSRKKFKSHKPFWNQELTNLWKIMCKKERQFRSFVGTRQAKYEKRAQFLISRKQFDKKLRYYERQFDNRFIEKLERINTSNPKEFWKTIKNLGPRKSKIPMTVYDDEGKECNDTNYVLNKWEKEFEKLYNRGNKNDENIAYAEMLDHKYTLETDIHTNDYLNTEITFDEVESVVNMAKKNKACGVDEIYNDILYSIDCKVALMKLFNVCFSNSVVPECWLKAIISPIPKSSLKDPFIPLSYRGVSLLSHVGKLYSQLLNKRIIRYCDQVDMLCEEQNGFRQSRSCMDHIFTLTSIIRNRLHTNNSTVVAFIDMQKAFDWADRDLLWYKLLIHNIKGKIYWAIRALYKSTVSCIRLNNLYTNWFKVDTGVRQGDNLSPTLFAIFINDLAIEIQNLGLGITVGDRKVSILLYADDIAILAENEENLQIMLNKLSEWCEKWHLTINNEKSQVVHFRKKRKARTSYPFKIGPMAIETVGKYRYLGVTLDENLDFKVSAQELAEAGGRALGGLISKFKTHKNIGYHTFTKLFNQGITPITDYCNGIWGFKHSSFAEKVQLRAARYFMGVNAKTPIHALTGDMGWITAKQRMFENILKYYNRLINMDHSRLTYKVFENDLQNISNENWSGDVENVLNQIGMSENIFTGAEIDINLAKEKLNTLIDFEWQDSVAFKPKLRTYTSYKSHISKEEYLEINLTKMQRSVLAKLRSCTLPLAIEKGRYKNEKFSKRICILCNEMEIEDEIHFVIQCPRYQNQRETFFSYICDNVTVEFNNIDVFDKFMVLMKLKGVHIRRLAKFLVSIWECRKSILYTTN